MDLRRSKRIPKPKTIWEAKGAPSVTSDPKVTKNTVRTEQQTVFKSIITRPLSKVLKIDENQLSEFLEYKPFLILQF